MFLHPASPLCVESVIKWAGPQLTSSLEVPAWNLQFVQQSCTKKEKARQTSKQTKKSFNQWKSWLCHFINAVKEVGQICSLLTHDFHDSVTQESSTALQVAEAFDIQRPHVGGGITIGHPLCQVPARQDGGTPPSLHRQSHWCRVQVEWLTCQLLLHTPGQMSSSRPERSSRLHLESRPSGSACPGWRTLDSWPADGSLLTPDWAFFWAERSALALKGEGNVFEQGGSWIINQLKLIFLDFMANNP